MMVHVHDIDASVRSLSKITKLTMYTLTDWSRYWYIVNVTPEVILTCLEEWSLECQVTHNDKFQLFQDR